MFRRPCSVCVCVTEHFEREQRVIAKVFFGGSCGIAVCQCEQNCIFFVLACQKSVLIYSVF
jgi:DNA gyrase inhibitor GyrI